MVSNTYLVRVLKDGGMNERRAEAFERWLDDTRPLGISSASLEACLVKHAAENVRKFDNLMEQTQAMYEQGLKGRRDEDMLQAFRH